jgi:hypothetical protein
MHRDPAGLAPGAVNDLDRTREHYEESTMARARLEQWLPIMEVSPRGERRQRGDLALVEPRERYFIVCHELVRM